MENLLKPENKTKLTDLLNRHAIAGKINFKDCTGWLLLHSNFELLRDLFFLNYDPFFIPNYDPVKKFFYYSIIA